MPDLQKHQGEGSLVGIKLTLTPLKLIVPGPNQEWQFPEPTQSNCKGLQQPFVPRGERYDPIPPVRGVTECAARFIQRLTSRDAARTAAEQLGPWAWDPATCAFPCVTWDMLFQWCKMLPDLLSVVFIS